MGPKLTPLAIAAHELKSPLALISHLARSLRDPACLLTSSERELYLERLELTAQRMLRLTQQLPLTFRMENEGQLGFESQMKPLSSRQVCQAALTEMAPYAAANGRKLELAGSKPHLVLAQRDILHDIVTNLLDNAIRHSQPGQPIVLSSTRRGDKVFFNVRDSSEPASPAELKKLAASAGKQLQPLSGRSGTSGMGLYIAQQFAQAMGGKIGVGRSASSTVFFVQVAASKQLDLLASLPVRSGKAKK